MERSARWVAVALALLVPLTAGAASLHGSKASLKKQKDEAKDHDFTYLTNTLHLKRFVNAGLLVKLNGNANYELHDVSYPFARPEVELFVNRLSAQYRATCGEKLIVTSLTRPLSAQPWNASDDSVHPTGMAMDLRRSNKRACRSWIERVLLALEKEDVLEATKERHPPHYHVAVFPREYAAYVNRLVGGERQWRVSAGETLWAIARETGTSVSDLRRLNGLRGNRIFAGQVLEVPAR